MIDVMLAIIFGVLIGMIVMSCYFKRKKALEDKEVRKEIEDLLRRAKENPKKKHRNKSRQTSKSKWCWF